MRKILFVSLLCVAIFSSCEKDDPGQLTDRWLWEKSFGGVGATTVLPQANTNVVLVLSNNNTYRIEKNGQTVVSDSFESRVENNVQVIKFKSAITVDNFAMNAEVSATVSNGKLVLSDYKIADGMAHTFTK